MPAAIAVIGAVVAGASAYAAGAAIITSVVIGVASLGASLLMQALAPQPKGPNQPSLANNAPDPQANIRQPISYWQQIYGQARVGGVITFEHSTNGNQTLHYLLTVAGHSVDEIGSLYLNDSLVPLTDNGDGSFSAAAPSDPDPSIVNWSGNLKVWKGLGTTAGDSALLSALSANCPDKWTSQHQQAGRAKVYLEFTYNSNLFRGGFPKVSVVVRGKKVFDPRSLGAVITSSAMGTPGVFTTSSAHGLAVGDEVYIGNHNALGGRDGGVIDGNYSVGTVPSSTTFTLKDCSYGVAVTTAGTGGNVTKLAWSPNPVLCLRDYMADRFVGPHILSTEIDDTVSGIGAANVCETYVTLASNSQTCTADAVANTLTLGAAVAWPTGTQVYVTTTGALPSGLAAGKPYYVINTSAGGQGSTTTYQLSDTQRDALDQVVTSLGSTGSGTLSISRGIAFTAAPATSILTVAYTSTTSTGTGATVYTTGAFPYRTGDQVKLVTTGTLPTGLSSSTTYYWISHDTQNGLLASSLANAVAKIPVTFTDAGTGTHVAIALAEQQYTCNGVLDTTKLPSQLIPEILSSMSGKVAWTAGQYVIIPGYWRTPMVTITRDDLIGPVQLQTTMARRDLYNKVKGTFIDPTAGWQPNDFPPVTNSAYVAADQGITLWSSIDLAFTDSSSTAQRLAKIALETARRQMTMLLQCKLTVLQTRVGDVLMVTDSRYGWTNKTFEIVDWTFSVKDIQQQGGGTAPFLGIDLLLRETDANVYLWTTADESISSVSPRTALPNPITVAPPTGLALASGTAYLFKNTDGTVVSPIRATWTAPVDAFVTNGGLIELQYRKSGTTTWLPGGFAPGSATSADITGVQDGASYDVRARSINSLGARSDADGAAWSATVSNYSVIGELQPPTTPASLTVQQNGATVYFNASPIPDLDTAAFEYRYGAVADWDSMHFIEAPAAQPQSSGQLFAASFTTSAVPPGTWWIGVKSKNTSGVYSSTATFVQATINSQGSSVIKTSVESPGWLGLGLHTSSGFLEHWTGVLVPDSTVLASAMTDAELWDTFNAYPVATAVYECAATIDIGFTDSVRVYASPLSFAPGPGVTGTVGVDFQIDAWIDGGTDPATFASWSAGTATARYVRARVVMTPGASPGVVTAFTPTIDKQPSAQSGNLAVTAGGTAITFSPAYHTVPSLNITASGANIAWYTSLTTTGAVLHVGPDVTHDNGGSASWQSTGT